MAFLVNLNGTILLPEEAHISVLDHGFLFGDSVYEVIRTYGGKPFFFQEHLARLRRSASRIFLPIPWDDDTWKREIQRTLVEAQNRESYIRIIVTRGVGEVSLDPDSCREPQSIIFVKEFPEYPPEYYTHGIKIIFANTRRNPDEALSPQIKSGNYLNNVLAFIEAKRQGAQESIMLNPRGMVTEGTTSNIFFARNGSLYTPALSSGILEGITRRFVLRLAQELSIPTYEVEVTPEEVLRADEVFLTSTTKEIMPVRQIGDHLFQAPGPMTIKLRKHFLEEVAKFQDSV